MEIDIVNLTTLKGQFIRLSSDGGYDYVDNIKDAQGVYFLCPKCFKENNGKVGTHTIICWFDGRGVPETARPKPGRWNPSGTGLDDLTFVPPGAVSVLLKGGCNWHGFVKNGDAT